MERDDQFFRAKTGRLYKSCNRCRCRHASLTKNPTLSACGNCGVTPSELFEKEKKLMLDKMMEDTRDMLKSVEPEKKLEIDIAFQMFQNMKCKDMKCKKR